MTIYNIIVDKQPYSNPSTEKRQYTIKIEELRRKGTVVDILSIESGKAVVTRKIGYYQGETYLLEEPIIEEIKDIDIFLFEGTNYIYVQNENNMILSAEYVIKNEFTDTYPTKIEMTTSINESANEIILNVNQILTNYDTREEVNSKISQTASEINLEVAKKVNDEELTGANIMLRVNEDTSEAQIRADKIELSAEDVLNLLSGNTINLSGKNIKISSNNFSVDENGNMILKSSDGKTEGTTSFIIVNTERYVELKEYYNRVLLKNSSAGVTASMMIGDAQSGILGDIGVSNNSSSASLTVEDGGTASMSVGNNNGNWSYVYPDYIKSTEFRNSSLESLKKNFEKLDNETALNIVLDTDIYKYNLKSQKDTDKKHIGFVIGDKYKYSKEITSQNNDGVNNYSMISASYGAIQKLYSIMQGQQTIIEQLQKEIKEMKGA